MPPISRRTWKYLGLAVRGGACSQPRTRLRGSFIVFS